MSQRNDFTGRVLVMGIGNYLMADEGLGVHLAQRLSEFSLPGNVDVIDGGTGGFHLLEYFENYSKIVLVDATLDDQPAGTIRLIKPKFAADFPKSMSTHDIGLKDMVSSLQLMGKVPEIFLFVVSIASIQEQGIQLTYSIEQVMPQLINKVVSHIGTITAREIVSIV